MSEKILLIEDDPVQQELLSLMLHRKLGYRTCAALDGQTALDLLKQQNDIRAVILDLNLPDFSGMELLDMISQQYSGLPVIILTGDRDIANAVQAIKAGAHDFIAKPASEERLRVTIKNAIKTSLLEKEVTRLKHQEESTVSFSHLIGHDKGLFNVIRTGRKAAASDIPVLLTGETGTGKEVFARAIHGESPRKGRPFIAVNCAAIPEKLIESILFGHEKGAFTGAIAKSIGKFREAEGGTIFLDEIGDLPLDAQAKLLRVLQQKEISPVGAPRTLPINVRVILATHKNLGTLVSEGLFRDDLYFRLNVLPIHMPALRDRSDDIPELVEHFMQRFSVSESKSLKTLSPDALKMLSSRTWPGNVRELENAIYRALVLSDKSILDQNDFSAAFISSSTVVDPTLPCYVPLTDSGGQARKINDIERDILEFCLELHNNNITQAAHALGIAKSTLYRKIKDHGIAVT